MIRHFLNPPNWFTSASIFCSTYAMCTVIAAGPAADPKILARACVLVIFGGVFDLLDGRVARMTNRFSEFGVQLDSIADVISFGVAPALLAWAWSLHELGGVGAFITFAWVLCASFRLARFNVETHNKRWKLNGHTQGLTTTMAGGALVTFVWVANGYLKDWLHPTPVHVAMLVSTLAFLMISSVPFRNFRDVRHNRWARRILAISMTACLASAVVLDPSMLFGMGAFLYLTAGVIDGFVVAIRARMLGDTLEPDDDVAIVDFVAGALAEYAEELEDDDEVEVKP